MRSRNEVTPAHQKGYGACFCRTCKCLFKAQCKKLAHACCGPRDTKRQSA
jgi:hypothetical protein